MEVYHKVKNIALPRGIRGSALNSLFCIKKMASSRKNGLRNRRLVCYTRFVLVIIYFCRLRGSTNRVFSHAVLLPHAIFSHGTN